MLREKTYKDDGHGGKYHNGPPLLDSLFAVFNRLPSLNDAGLLLL
jgi:hypothetical protein